MGRANGEDLLVTLQKRPERHLVHHRMRYQGGKLLFVRRGHLNPVRQDTNGSFCQERAPRRRGIWAFPWPWSDPFFSQHKFWETMPKHLSLDSGDEQWQAIQARYKPLLEQASDAEQRLIWDRMLAEYEPIERKLEEERERWIRKVGRKHVPLRQFWYGGELYSHLNRHGQVLSMDEWALLSVPEFYQAARKLERREVNRDPLEVFIPSSAKLR